MEKLTDRRPGRLITEGDVWRDIAEVHAAAGRWDAAKQYYELAESAAAESSRDGETDA